MWPIDVQKFRTTALFFLLPFPYGVEVVQSTSPSSLSHDVMRDEVTVVIMCPEGAGILPVSLYEHRCRGLAGLNYSRSCRTAAHWKHDCQEQYMPAPLTPQSMERICILSYYSTYKYKHPDLFSKIKDIFLHIYMHKKGHELHIHLGSIH